MLTIICKVLRTIYDGIGPVWKMKWLKTLKSNFNITILNYMKNIILNNKHEFANELRKTLIIILIFMIVILALFKGVIPEHIVVLNFAGLWLSLTLTIIGCRSKKEFIKELKGITKSALKLTKIINIVILLIAALIVLLYFSLNYLKGSDLASEIQLIRGDWQPQLTYDILEFIFYIIIISFSPLIMPLLVVCIYWLFKPIVFIFNKIIDNTVKDHPQEPLKLFFWVFRVILCIESILIFTFCK